MILMFGLCCSLLVVVEVLSLFVVLHVPLDYQTMAVDELQGEQAQA